MLPAHAHRNTPSPAPRPLEAIGDDIARLSATIAAATYQLLCLIEELDRSAGWGSALDSTGFRSPAHWLSWRIGLDLGAARQYVRVARALPPLPRISAAFAAGELSYSKVRAITRIADPDNEELLLDWARAGTASHVEKLVRRYRRGDVAGESERARDQEAARGLVTYWDSDGMLVVQARLPPDQGALLLEALESSADALCRQRLRRHRDERAAQDGSAETPRAPGPAGEPRGDQRGADALARVASQALARDAAGASAATAARFQVVVHVDAEVLADPESDGRCELEDGPALAGETARRLACDATVCAMVHGPDGALEAGRRRRTISAPLRRALRSRDGTGCAFPGCSARGRDAHHVQHWAAGGPTVLLNLIPLCRAHHTLVHEGGYRVETRPGGGFAFRRPDGRALPAAPALPAVTGDPAAQLASRWLPPNTRIDGDTGLPTWAGEPADYDWMLALLGSQEQGEGLVVARDAQDRSPPSLELPLLIGPE